MKTKKDKTTKRTPKKERIPNQISKIRKSLEKNEPPAGPESRFKKSSGRKPGNNNQLSKEDREALGPRDLSLDMGEDERLLKHRKRPVDFSGKDLDVPGSELDDPMEDIGSEDEENNLYGIGGDRHEDLEEDKS